MHFSYPYDSHPSYVSFVEAFINHTLLGSEILFLLSTLIYYPVWHTKILKIARLIISKSNVNTIMNIMKYREKSCENGAQ